MAFPVIHSTLDPAALTAEIERRYDFRDAISCRLINRANNDFYEIRAGDRCFALRVAKANFRTNDAYAYELDLLTHLDRAGCRVPAPLKARDGSTFFTVEAPEGIRAVAIFQWLSGRPFTKALTAADAGEIGAALARLHLAGQSFQTSFRRLVNNADYVGQHMPALADMLAKETVDRDFYLKAEGAVRAAYDRIAGDGLPTGQVHGDFQFANVMREGDGTIAALDFDTCGEGYLAEDIFTFIWRSDMEIRDERVNAAFINGYETHRPLSADERRALPLFRAARDLVMCTTYAILINRVGPLPGFDGDFGDFTRLARRHLSDAGLC